VLVADDDPVRMMFTSGTESRPKGALLSSRGLMWQYVSCALDGSMSADELLGMAERKILEILRGRHHHGMGNAVVNQRDRNLFDDVLSRFPRVAVDPALSRMVDNDGRDHDHSSAGEDLRPHHPRETDGEELTPHVRDGMYDPGPRAHS